MFNISGGSWIDLLTASRVIPRNDKAMDGHRLSLVQGGRPAPGKLRWQCLGPVDTQERQGGPATGSRPSNAQPDEPSLPQNPFSGL